jgi:hypothetical protein
MNEKELKKIIEESAVKDLVHLYKWLFVNYLPILREYERTRGSKFRIMFAGGLK